MKQYYFMPQKKTKYLGARFTEEEEEFIKKFSEERDMTISDLLREAVFSHIDFLKEIDGKYKQFIGYIIKSSKIECTKH